MNKPELKDILKVKANWQFKVSCLPGLSGKFSWSAPKSLLQLFSFHMEIRLHIILRQDYAQFVYSSALASEISFSLGACQNERVKYDQSDIIFYRWYNNFYMGIVHLFPTKSIVKGFGDISIDNRNIVTMEWIIEGIVLIFIGAIVIGSAVIDSNDHLAVFNYLLSAFVLFVLAIILLFTGYKVNYLPFKLCSYYFHLQHYL